MNDEAQKRLDNILKKEPEALTSGDREFLRARRTYLKKSQLDEYKEVFKTQEEKPQENAIGYQELLTKAKEAGYRGPRIRRNKLEEYIASKNNNPFS